MTAQGILGHLRSYNIRRSWLLVVSVVMALLASPLVLPGAWAKPQSVMLSKEVARTERPPGIKELDRITSTT